MKQHSSGKFLFDEELTELTYSRLDYGFSDSGIRDICLETITKAVDRHSLDIGIDFQKPWEEIELDENHFQLEYLFAGEMKGHTELTIDDQEIGINIFRESRFGAKEFGHNRILNLTLIVER